MAMRTIGAAWMGAVLLTPLAANAQQRQVEAFAPVPATVTPNLRDLPTVAPWQPGDPIKEVPRRSTHIPKAVQPPVPAIDALRGFQQAAPQTEVVGPPTVNIQGGTFSGVNPPDTVGDIGLTQYVQAINVSGGSAIRVYDKAGTLLAGPTLIETLGTTAPCNAGLGDPIVLWDNGANRWLLSEFSSSGNRLCVYVSQTADATGPYFAYQFQAINFPDYPKYSVWPDAYYVGTNENNPAAYAMQRSAMLTGAAAALQRFVALPELSGFGFQLVLPADWDGATAPPVGAPAVFVRHKDSEAHGSPGAPDTIELFEFHVDFTTPTNSTFTGPVGVNVTEFDSDMCGLNNFSCIPQPSGTQPLDPVQQPIMHRPQYRNRGTHQAIVASFTVDVTGGNVAGVRWFELRKIGAGAWTLFQEGTQSLDTTNRWMSSIAMDVSGNIALGYNVSSSAVFPGLRYVGRQSTDPVGTMGGEITVIAGTASNGSTRYGDYASLNVDPVNDCDFWFTGMHNATSQWTTRIAKFRFPAGECVDVPVELMDFSIQ